MQKLWIIAVAIFAIAAMQGCSGEQVPASYVDLVIKDVTVVSSGNNGGSPKLEPVVTNVLVQDGRIVFIGDSVSDRVSDATTVIDGTDRFLMPGLIDGHTHLSEIPGMTTDHELSFPEIAAAARTQIPQSYLYYGFTTVVDLNSQPRYIDHWNAQPIRPQAYFCGAAPVFDGYPMSSMPKPARYEMMHYFLFDEPRANDFPEGFDPLNHTPQAVVDRIHSDGGICVKTHYEKGFGGRANLPVPSSEQINALVGAAHNKGMPVLMHANSESAQSFGIETDVDAFAHGMWTWNDRSLIELHVDIKNIIDATMAKGISLQPTVQVLYGEQDMHDPDYLDDPRLKHVLPASLLAWYATDDGQWWRQRMLNIPIVKRLVEEGLWEELDAPPIARVTEVLRYFANNGGSLLFGSDTPSDPTFANPPGLNGRIEMDRWIAASVIPVRIFTAATISNARFFGLDDEVGTIEVGKQADLLVLRSNPLDDVAAYDTIEYVILDGAVIERSALSAVSKH